jgi:PAS domain S-box-containing protein
LPPGFFVLQTPGVKFRLSLSSRLIGAWAGLGLALITGETSAAQATQAAAPGARQVLLIHSLGRDYPPFEGVGGIFHKQLVRLSTEPIEILNSSLELSRFDGPELGEPLLQYIRAVYPDSPPDLIVPIGAQAGFFHARHRDELFPDTPVLLLGLDKRRFREISGPGVTAVGMDLDVTVLVDNVLELLPETKHLYMVTGTTPMSRFWRDTLLREWQVFEQLTLHDLSEQSVAEINQTVSALPPDSVVMVVVMTRDAAGVPHESGFALRSIRSHSVAPVFGYLPAQLGDGIVGGSLLPTPEVGRRGAEIAARILTGEPPDEIEPIFLPFGKPMYDWREIIAWGISPDRIPPDSTILHQQPTLWEEHRTAVLLGLTVVLIQSALVILLLVTRRRAREIGANLRVAAEAAEIGLWRRSSKSNTFVTTPRCRELFGFTEKEIPTLDNVFSRIVPEDRSHVQSAIQQAAQHGHNFALETRVQLPDGPTRWLSLHGRAQPDRQGERYGTHGAVLDITERKAAETRVEEHRHAMAHLSRVSSLGALSGAFAHELTQPLGSILHNAQALQNLLREDPPSLEEIQDIVDDIVSEDRRAGEVIQRLRDLLRRGETTIQSLDLNQQVIYVLQLMRVDLERRDVQWRKSPSSPPITIAADPIQIQQIIINLITNACDAMAELPTLHRILEITTDIDGDQITLAIRDHGPGVPDDVESLFEPFHTTKPQGLGIGLVICRTLIGAHGGSLQAENHPEGGAVFTVRFPLPPTSP